MLATVTDRESHNARHHEAGLSLARREALDMARRSQYMALLRRWAQERLPAGTKAAADAAEWIRDALPAGKDPGVETSADHGSLLVRLRARLLADRSASVRARIAERLLQAQQQAAMLTTFNEVDMTAVMALRQRYQEPFTTKHGVKLGFMGFFVKAAVEALRQFPLVNASIDGSDIVYHEFFDIGVAVSTDRGLVVPVLRNAEFAGVAEIERSIRDFGERARKGGLQMEELTGGTFTITNGGIFGSLMSTPILNPPQSGILGMHKIQQRPMVVDGKVEARPMMYLALTYDHRVIDGKEAVTFLVRVKESLEDPARLVLEL